MEILYLLIPLSAVIVLLIIAVFGWALNRGQFDDLEREGERILMHDKSPFEHDQAARRGQPEQSASSNF
jgi:cbb3-type cytochrome oxidase maturation protein